MREGLPQRRIDELHPREVAPIESAVSAQKGFSLQQRVSSHEEIRDQLRSNRSHDPNAILAPERAGHSCGAS
jgi:hypothetical protein